MALLARDQWNFNGAPGADDHTSNREGSVNANGGPNHQATTEAIIDELSLHARQEDKCGKKEKQPDKKNPVLDMAWKLYAVTAEGRIRARYRI